MTPLLIDTDKYIRTGEGANGASYDVPGRPDMMVKLYNEGYDAGAIRHELEVARTVYALGIPSPEPGELVTDGTRLGIRFRKIRGKRSFARAIADEPERVEAYAREFAAHCKRFHTTVCPAGTVPDAKKDFLKLLEASHLDADEKAIIKHFIVHRAPESRTALHGDMHFGNALTTLPAGAPLSQPHDIYFIDLGYFGYGCPLFDIGMTWMICNISDRAFVEHDMHFTLETAREAWKYFCDAYFFGPERLAEAYFGAGATPEDVADGLTPYVIAKLLLVEYNVGFMPPHYLRFIKKKLPSLA